MIALRKCSRSENIIKKYTRDKIFKGKFILRRKLFDIALLHSDHLSQQYDRDIDVMLLKSKFVRICEISK